YLDALYFTIASLTTTGYGDIVLQGVFGKLLSIFIMVLGISLFLRLVQAIVRPSKVTSECTRCGLLRHEPDAIHCKHCGEFIRLPTHNE
ncbi:MAG TPA: ion transporter, partial [Hyphomonadaceae bacterium]|nr:ion transporter [Hyphomonadaceae bacterium]